MTGGSLCEICVGEGILKKDFVLHVISSIAATQTRDCCKLTIDKKKNSKQLELNTTKTNPAVTITQRNAILRALVTTALQGILDRAPLYLAGSKFGSTVSGGNSVAALQRASLTAWMGVAEGVRQGSPLDDALEEQLTKYAFLLPGAPAPTVADFDLAIATIEAKINVEQPVISRWMQSTISILLDHANMVGVPIPDFVTQWVASNPPAQTPAWWFSDGTESIDVILPKETPGKDKSQGKQQSKKQQAAGNKDKSVEEQPKDNAKNQDQDKKVKQTDQEAPSADGPDITALDIRVGRIVKVWNHPEADKLFCEEIDLGTEVRQIASGLRPYYKESDLQDAHVLVLCNLKKRNLVGFPSHGMVLCASKEDGESKTVELVAVPKDTPLGERVKFQGKPDVDPEPENKIAKKKIFEKLAPELRTDNQGQVVFKGSLCSTSKGAVMAINGMADAQVS